MKARIILYVLAASAVALYLIMLGHWLVEVAEWVGTR